MHPLRLSRTLSACLATPRTALRPAHLTTTRYFSTNPTSASPTSSSLPTFSNLLFTHTGPLITITLNRPTLHNAFNQHVIADLTAAFTHPLLVAPAAVDGPRVVVLRSTGASFSAGGDLNWMGAMKGYSREENIADAVRLFDMFHAIHSCPLPVIARVQGAAYGGGVGLIAACDTAIATQHTQLALTEVRLGLAPAVISPFVLNRVGGAGAGVGGWVLTGERVGAERAREMGLVGLVVADEAALDVAVDRFVRDVVAGGPEAVRRTKRLVQEVSGSNERLERVKKYVTELIAELRVSDEGQEGVGAFLEKRKPAWILPSSAGKLKAENATTAEKGST